MAEKQHIIYTAEDIKKYLEGNLTPAQMHAIEKAALDDEFLAEAIEGYSKNADKKWNVALDEAKAKFNVIAKKDETKIVALPKTKTMWWRAAAVILVIAGSAITYNLLTKPGKIQPEIAANKTIETNDVPLVNLDTNAPKKDITAAAEQNIVTDKAASKTTAVNTNAVTNGVTTTPDTKETLANAKAETKGIVNAPEKINPVATAPAGNAAAAKEDIAKQNEATASYDFNNIAKNEAVKKAKAAPTNYNFISQVVAADNTPLPFANISIKNENFGTYADVKGNFRLISSDSLLTVEVKSVGYLPKYYTLNAKTNLNKIVLTEDKIDAKNQVVIKSSNTNKASRKVTFLKDTIINVEPADGWDNYGTYVSNNIEIPDDLLKDKTRRNEVEVSFNVNATGAITDIKIDKSACNNCDEEAVKKLIQQGPQWKLKNGKTGAAKIKVQF
ncbi:MAG: carboxypeptidase-like regulatory domain-containing protein [Chitinophagaceae bacterium]|nr:carboxypeptidase-like regulatory domain-containing protein [Chitinophagaceae bacterium]